MQLADLTPAERRVWRAFPKGQSVGFGPGDEEAVHGGSWGPARTVRAEVLRSLLLNGSRADGEIAGLWIVGGRISGLLDLSDAVLEHSVRLLGCHFERPPILYGARTRRLNLRSSYLPALDAVSLQVDGHLRLSGCEIPGQVRLGGARLAGALFLDGARIGDSDGDEGEEILQFDHGAVENDLSAAGAVIHGRFTLTGSTVGGNLDFDRAELRAPGHVALDAENLAVGGHLSGEGLRAQGTVNLRGATITRHLDLVSARLSAPGATALRATSCTIGELWLRGAAPIEGAVNLRRSHVEIVFAEPRVWPERVGLDGLTYRSLLPPLPAAERLALLEREDLGYVPHPYEQLAGAYRLAGDDAAARTVQLAKQRRRRATLPWYARCWGHVQDVTVGYGFRPMRAAVWLVALMLTAATAYGLHRPQPLKPGEAPDFNPVFYTLDLLLPIIDFGQEKAFKPRGWHQWLAYLLVVLGWVLATTIVAGVTRAVSRQ
ncbi:MULTISPECIES: membrane-associated oxidoreductase [Actinomadura]|uniref:Membrane-associated oxidoreductase n=1 Tax=Actinomadura yumaensis TaxID=111807 RepID=A0ABW2CKJ9_9ACTN|nr:membrane-associated oxidoreductase [Actinomadura sp. J1-007]MWK36829.1 membrane-associated oxidoreductase [Actinomadura sp. J1-007]